MTDGGVTALMALLRREDPIVSCERDITTARAKQKEADSAADEAGWAVATARLNYHLDRYQKLTRAEPTAAAR